MQKPLLYTAFHLNLAFSSIEEEDRPDVVRRCYDPLLGLAEGGIPIGIELTGYTLENIHDIDPTWTQRLKKQIQKGTVELVGSGFTQLIGPLAPPELVLKNLEIGDDVYETVLGVKPKIALVNEQAYAPGLLPIYKQAGYEAIMMDYAEPASHHPEWPKQIRLQPQTVIGAECIEMPVLWSDAMAFQKFQRYAHNELTLQEYSDYLVQQLSLGARALPIYTSDAEVFDYRPGRFDAEAAVNDGLAEWERIRLLLEALQNLDDVRLCLPSDAVKSLEKTTPIALESADVPVPVKKQKKYNITRWAVTGRNDLKLNTLCWRAFENLNSKQDASSNDWRNLCLAFASDLRTHITETRWRNVPDLLSSLPVEHKTNTDSVDRIEWRSVEDFVDNYSSNDCTVWVDHRFLCFQLDGWYLVLNTARGCAIHAMGFGKATDNVAQANEKALVGTLVHGFFDDIAVGADFYSGHMVIEPPSGHKITDLQKVTPQIAVCSGAGKVLINMPLSGALEGCGKIILVSLQQPQIEVKYDIGCNFPKGSAIHVGFLTLNPRIFDVNSLMYGAHNGGQASELHNIVNDQGCVRHIKHDQHVSRLVSATTALGMTEGQLVMRDDKNRVVLHMDKTDAAGVGMLESKPVAESYFVRSFISIAEADETSAKSDLGVLDEFEEPRIQYSIKLEAKE